mmetsp:Transcript_36382/g.58370  ORF Transcript_36382/g.58370 Transcript_36382/m.58370 type:complete len:919 (+) Transcript_36382:1219-3975(+)
MFGVFSAAVNEMKSEVDQVSKISSSPEVVHYSSTAKKTGDNKKSVFREELLALEEVKKQLEFDYQQKCKSFRLQVSGLELEVSKLKCENERLQWEPRKARDGLVLLCVSLSSAFTLVCFALFYMAELHLSQGRDFSERMQGYLLLLLGGILLFGAVPLTHMSGHYLYGRVGYKFYQPGQGGRLYVLLQALGWFCYATFLMVIMQSVIYDNFFEGSVTFSGVCGIVAHVCMVSSLLSFRPVQSVSHSRVRRQSSDGGYSSSGSTSYHSDSDGSPHDSNHSTMLRSRNQHRRRSSRRQRLDATQSADVGMEYDLWLDPDLAWNTGYKTLSIDSDTALFGAFMALQSTLVIIACALAFLSERAVSTNTHRVTMSLLCMFLIAVAAFLTQGLGGALWHRASWKFFQPFAGGTKFLLLQGVVWGTFSLCIASSISCIGVPMYLSSRLLPFSQGWSMTYTGLAAVLGHFLLVLSISYYERESPSSMGNGIPADVAKLAKHFYFSQIRDAKLLEETAARMSKLGGLRNIFGTMFIATLCNTQYVCFVIVTLLFYTPFPLLCMVSSSTCIPQPDDTFPALQKFSLCIVVFTIGYSILKTFQVRGTFLIMGMILLTAIPVTWTLYQHHDSPIQSMLRVYCAMFMLYNYRTYSGTPELRGTREWKAFREYSPLWDLYQDYVGGNLISDEKLDEFEKIDGKIGSSNSSIKQAIWCFHPHGIFPTTMIWLPNAKMFRNRFPNVWLNSLTATIIHLTPLMRDVAQWAGVRDVGRASVEHTLKKGDSPMLVVGGQSEMFLSKAWEDKVAFHRRHRGFVRMAIRHGVPLIPTVSFGEWKSMSNVELPRMQAWFKDRVGFPIPYFPYGRWYLPVTRRSPITVCVGAPIIPKNQSASPTKEQIDELHTEYFTALEDLWQRNKAKCGYPDMNIEWH